MVQQEPVTVQQHLRQPIDNSVKIKSPCLHSSAKACDSSASLRQPGDSSVRFTRTNRQSARVKSRFTSSL